jgi:hypothetical protein
VYEMGNAYYITRRRKWSRTEGASITEEEWRAHIDADEELVPCEGETTEADAVSWESHDGVFRLERGNIVGDSSSSDVLSKMVAMAEKLGARATCHNGVVYVESTTSSSSTCSSRRVIPRAGASLLLSIVGLVLIGVAVALRVGLNHEDAVISLAGSLLSVVTLPLISVGIVSLFVSVMFAVSSLYPWDRHCSKYAVIALLLDGLPLLFMT